MLGECPRANAAPRPSRAARRVFSLLLCGTLSTLGTPADAAPRKREPDGVSPDANEIERLYKEGTERAANKDYKGAVEKWKLLMRKLPESGANQATRENVLLNILEASMNAYDGNRKPDGSKDIAYLMEGRKEFERYVEDYAASFGPERALGAAVREQADELDAMLKAAEEETKRGNTGSADPAPNSAPSTEPKAIDKPPPPVVLPPQQNGIGFIAGGSVMIAVGLGAVGMAVAGGIGSQRAENDFNKAKADNASACADPMSATCSALRNELDDLDTRGRRNNAIATAGGVLAGVLVGGGIALLVIGIKRNRAAKSVALLPSFGRGTAGLVFNGRF